MKQTAGIKMRNRIKTFLDTSIGRYLVPISFVVLLFGTPLALFLLERAVSPVSSWYNSSWEYRKPITVTNGGAEQLNYDVLIELDTATLIAGNKIQADCDDIRVVGTDDTTLLSYWIEGGCNTATTQIWARVPTLAAGENTIYLYYGNGAAINAEESWSGKFYTLNTGACSTSWTSESGASGLFENRLIRFSDTGGSTGGASSSSHSRASCTATQTAATVMAKRDAGTIGYTEVAHSHGNVRADVNTNTDVLPPYTDMIICSSGSLNIKTGQIIPFTASAPSGWSAYSSADTRFPRGASSAGGTGGATTHTHSTTGGYNSNATAHSVSTGRAIDGETGPNAIPRDTHYHVSQSGTAGSGNNVPIYTDFILAQADSDISLDPGLSLLSSNLPPLGWTRNSVADNRYLRANSAFGGTGGSTTHTHSVTITTGSSVSNTVLTNSNSGAVTSHTHSCSATTSSDDNLPPYATALLIEKNDNSEDSVSLTVDAEESNAPAAPSSTAAQGLSTTSIRWNFTDNANNEIGFKVYDENDVLMVTCAQSDLTYCDETGLSPNTQYTRKITAYNAQGESGFSDTVSRYTLIGDPTISFGTVAIDSIEMSASGSVNLGSGSSGIFFDCTDASCDTGINAWLQTTTDTATGLSANTGYGFRIKARNGDSVETSYSSTEQKYTLANTPTISATSIAPTEVELTAGNVANLGSGTSGVYFDCIDASCDTDINTWIQTAADSATGLSPNTQYTFQVKARNGESTETSYSTTIDVYSGVYTPSFLSVSALGVDSASVVVDEQSNPVGVEYAVIEQNSGNFINPATGLLQPTVVWANYSTWGDTDGVTVTNLESGVEYAFRVKARNGDNVETEYSVADVAVTDLSTPTSSAPTVLSSTSIRWNFSDVNANEDGFKVYDASNNLVVTCAQVDLTYCDETGLTPNTQYTRKVNAYNNLIDSGYSGTQTVYTHAQVPSITGLSATTSSMTLTVSMGTNPGDTQIAIQEVNSGNYVSSTDGTLGEIDWATYATFNTNTAFEVVGLSANESYSFRIKARNGDTTETAFSGSSSLYTLAVQPPAPTVSATSSTSVTTIISQGTNSSQTLYALQIRYVNDTSEWIDPLDGSISPTAIFGTFEDWGSASGVLISGLDVNTLYTFRSRAQNGDGINTVFSDVDSAYTLTSAPSITSATASSSTVIAVVLNAGGNPAVTEFALYNETTGNYVNYANGAQSASAVWGTFEQFGSGSGLGAVGLSPNTQYTFKVKARNVDEIEGALSSGVSEYTLANTPASPTVTDVSTTSARITLVTSGNPATTQYVIQEVGSGEFVDHSTGTLGVAEVWGTFAQFGSGSGILVTGLSTGTEYEFRVKARNGDEIETAYSSSSAETTRLESPTIGTPEVIGTTSIRWTFTDNEANETGFRVYDEEDVQVAQCVGQNLTYCDEFGLAPNTAYTRTIVAYNAVAVSNLSASASATTLAATPSIESVSASSSTTLNVKIVSGSNPDSTQYALQEEVSGLFVQTNGSLSASPSWNTRVQYGGDSGVNIGSLFANASYTFKVKARNSQSLETSYSTATSRYTLAVTPTLPTLASNAATRINVRVENAGNPPFTQFAIQEVNSGKYVNRSSGTLADSADWNTYSQWGSTNGINVSSLSANTQYSFKTITRNGDNVLGEFSPTRSLYTLSSTPTSVVGAIDGANGIRIDVRSNNPAGTEYVIRDSVTGRYLNSGVTNGVSESPVWRAVGSDGNSGVRNISGLVAGREYRVSARTRNGDGVESPFSTEVVLRTLARPVDISAATPTSTRAINVRINPTDNDATVQYSLREINSGRWLDYSDNLLKTDAVWGTYTQWGGTSGTTVLNLDPARDYIFRAQSRNASGVVTGFGSFFYAGTNAVIENLPNSVRVALKADPSLDPTSYISQLRGLKEIRVRSGEYLLADVPVSFDANRDWTDAVAQIDAANSKSVIKLDSDHGFSGQFTMYVVKGDTNAFVLCPGAVSLSDVSSDCTDRVLFIGPFPETKLVDGRDISVSIAIIDGVQYWVVSGLSGTGGQGVTYTPGGGDVVAPSDNPQAPEEPVDPNEQDEDDGGITPINTNSQIINNIVNSNAVNRTREVVNQTTKAVEGVLNDTVGNLPSEQLTVVTTTTSATTVAVGIASISGGLSQIPYYLTQALFGLLTFLGFRKRGKPYGYVYDSVSKKPISRAVVRIYNQSDKLIWTDVTDAFGAFSADLPAGKYKLLVRKSGYTFPTKLIVGKQDYPLEPVYHGEVVSLNKKATVRYVIPIDPPKESIFNNMSVALRSRLNYLFNSLHIVIFLAGIILALYTYNKFQTTANLLVLVVYIPTVVILLRSIFSKPRSYGSVKDEKGKAVKGVIIGLKELEFDRWVGKRITDSKGQYQFLVPMGTYQLEILNDDMKAVKYEGGSNVVKIQKREESVIAKKITVKRKK